MGTGGKSGAQGVGPGSGVGRPEALAFEQGPRKMRPWTRAVELGFQTVQIGAQVVVMDTRAARLGNQRPKISRRLNTLLVRY